MHNTGKDPEAGEGSGSEMVKGVARRVIVVKSPDPKLFEQAIFLVKEGAAEDGIPEGQVLCEARKAADRYLRQNRGPGRKLRKLSGLLWAALGAGGASALWFFLTVL